MSDVDFEDESEEELECELVQEHTDKLLGTPFFDFSKPSERNRSSPDPVNDDDFEVCYFTTSTSIFTHFETILNFEPLLHHNSFKYHHTL